MDYKGLCEDKPKIPISKMKKQELIKKIKFFRDNWEKMTKRDMDSSNEWLNSLSVKDLRQVIKFYYSTECKNNAIQWINKPKTLWELIDEKLFGSK